MNYIKLGVNMKILITGANGMLGTDLKEVLKNEEVIATDLPEVDITNKEQIVDFVNKHNPDVIINSAAYTDVDGCETNETIAYDVNVKGCENLAIAAKQSESTLVHISTDYVFNGDNTKPWEENDKTGPISVYGKTKLQGELAIKKTFNNFFIIRTAWLYGINGNCFPKTMLDLSKNHKEISVVNDQVGSPTYTNDLAIAISQLIKTDYYGTYHVTNSGSCSWYEFAKLIFELSKIDVEVKPVTTSEFPRPAPRPKYSVLSNNMWKNNGFEPLRDYKIAIEEYLNLLNRNL